MTTIKRIAIFISVLFAGTSSSKAQGIILKNGDSVTCQVALNNMFDSIYALKYAKFEMESYERIEGKMQKNQAMVYLEYEPRKIFVRGYRTDNELANEILYKHGENNNKALISPNGFPYFNLNLDPTGSTMRNDRHLTILEAGGRYLVDMLRLGIQAYMKSGDSTNRFYIERSGKDLLKLTLTNPDYRFIEYTVLPNEQVREICNKLGVPEYKLIEMNHDVDDFEDLIEGQTILVPNFYAQKFELIIRESDFVPLHVVIYDDLGLYSEYKYLYFDCHPYIDSQTFSHDNPAYSF